MNLFGLAFAAACVLCAVGEARQVGDVVASRAMYAGLATTAQDRLIETSPVHLRSLLQNHGASWNNPRVHGYLMAISFGLLLPLSVVLSRNFKEFTPAWFNVHRILGIVAWIVGTVGVAFGQHLFDTGPVQNYHRVIGWIVWALILLQILIAVIGRPPLDHKLRSVWNQGHHWLGRAIVALAVVNVFLGLHVSQEYHRFWWGYGIILFAIVMLGVIKELIDWRRLGMHHTSLRDKAELDKYGRRDVAADRRRSIDGPQDGGLAFLSRSPVAPAPDHSATGGGVKTAPTANGGPGLQEV